MCIIVCLINSLWFCLNEHNLEIFVISIYAERNKNIYNYVFLFIFLLKKMGLEIQRDTLIPPGMRRAHLSAPP